MIDGLKVTLTGEQIRKLIDERVAEHRSSAAHWNRESARTLADQTEDQPLLPEHMCQHEAGRHEWRAEVLTFLRDHLDPSEIYRLGETDLEFAELLPAPPASVEQDEYDERARMQSDLGPFARRICNSPEIIEVVNPDWKPSTDRKTD